MWNKAAKNHANCEKTPRTCALVAQIPHAVKCTHGLLVVSVHHALWKNEKK